MFGIPKMLKYVSTVHRSLGSFYYIVICHYISIWYTRIGSFGFFEYKYLYDIKGKKGNLMYSLSYHTLIFINQTLVFSNLLVKVLVSIYGIVRFYFYGEGCRVLKYICIICWEISHLTIRYCFELMIIVLSWKWFWIFRIMFYLFQSVIQLITIWFGSLFIHIRNSFQDLVQ